MTGKRVGLVIGSNYPNSNKELRFAVADALKMKEVLLNKDICGFDGVEESIDDTFLDARIKIERILKNANHGDLIFIYFSGHGKKHLDNGLRLLFKDTNEEYLLATSLNFDYINRCMKYPSQKAVIIVLDCCYSGAAGIRDIDVMEALKKYSSSGTIILTSTGLTGSPAAREEEKFGHGIFTYYLIEGLEKGYADKGNGYISIEELYDYAFEKTKSDGYQSPKKEGSIEGSIFIGRNPQKIRENEYNSKKSKLISEYVRILSPLVFNESMTILRKAYYVPSSLDAVEVTTYGLLNSLLKSELQPDNYSDAVQHLKGISVSPENSLNKSKIDNSIPFTQTTNVQKSSFQEVEYQSVAWKNQNYSLIQIEGEKYIPLKSYSKDKLATLVIDLPLKGEKYTIKTGEMLDLGKSYGLEAKQIDVDGEKVWLEFTKDGEFVDDEILNVRDGSDNTWTITLNNIQGENNVSVFKVHVSRLFQGMVDSIVQINGLWLIDFKNAVTIKSGDKLNGYEITEINDEYISYKSIDH